MKAAQVDALICGGIGMGAQNALCEAGIRLYAAMEPQLVRLEEPRTTDQGRMIEIRYGKTELKLPEDVDLKALTVFLNALRRHD